MRSEPRARVLLLLVLLTILIATVFGSTFQQSILAETASGRTSVEAVAPGTVPQQVEASIEPSTARTASDRLVAFRFPHAEPLLLLLLGSMLFSVAAGISFWVSRVEPD